jgi:hypothetical protein
MDSSFIRYSFKIVWFNMKKLLLLALTLLSCNNPTAPPIGQCSDSLSKRSYVRCEGYIPATEQIRFFRFLYEEGSTGHIFISTMNQSIVHESHDFIIMDSLILSDTSFLYVVPPHIQKQHGIDSVVMYCSAPIREITSIIKRSECD